MLLETCQQQAVEVMMLLQRNLTTAYPQHNDESGFITFSARVALRRLRGAPDIIERG